MTQIGLYNIIYSSMYVVEKNSTEKRESAKTKLMQKLAATRQFKTVTYDESDESMISHSVDSDFDESF